MKIKPQDINVDDVIIAERHKYSNGTGPSYVLVVTKVRPHAVENNFGIFHFSEFTFHKLTDDYITITSNTNVL